MPASFDCAPEEQVKWSHVQGIMVDIKKLADDYGYAYSSPVSNTGKVWSVADVPEPSTLGMYFVIAAGVITDAFLVEAIRAPKAWEPEPYMVDLINRESLIAIVEDDACLCNTMWLVVPSGGGYTLKATSDLPDGCCPTLKVPKAGDVVEAGPFIPSRALRRKPRNITGMFDAETCRAGGSSVVLYSQGSVVGVQREMKLRLTWAIKKWQFDQLEEEWHKLIYQTPGFSVQTPGLLSVPDLFLCGSAISANLTNGVMPAVPDGLAGCVLAKMLKAWKDQYNPDLAFDAEWGVEPGCVDVSSPTGKSAWLHPWKYPTCAAEACDERQRVYCNSIKWMNNMVTMLKRMLCPKDTEEGFNWATQASVTITHATNAPGVSVSVIMGASLVISGSREATVVCGGDHSALTGLAVVVSVVPLCGPRRFNVSITGSVRNVTIYNQSGEDECPDPYVPSDIWPGVAWVGPASYAGPGSWRHRAGREVELCTDTYTGPGYCEVDNINKTEGSNESPAITPGSTLEVTFNEYNLAEISCTITITPLLN